MLYRQHNHHVNDPLHYPVNPCTSLSTNEVGVVSNSTASHHVRAMHATSSSQMQRKYGMRWICNNNDGDYHRISLPTSQPSAASRHTEIMARIDENEIHPFLMHPPSLCLTYDQPFNEFFPSWIWCCWGSGVLMGIVIRLLLCWLDCWIGLRLLLLPRWMSMMV